MIMPLLKTSLFMSAVIAALALLTRAFNRPAIARWRYVCRLIVAVFMLIPWRFNVMTFRNDEDYGALITTALAAGDAPEIIFPDFLYTMDIYKAMESGTFLNMKCIMDDDPDFHREDYVESVMDAVMYRGRQYIVPLSFDFFLETGSTKKLNKIGFDVSKNTDMVSFLNEVTRVLPKDQEAPGYEKVFSNYNYWQFLFESSGLEMIDYENRRALPDESIYMLQHFMNNNFYNLNYARLSVASLLTFAVIMTLVLGMFGFRQRAGDNQL